MAREMTVQQLRERLDKGEPTVLLDVRKPWEFERAVIAGSVNIPLDELEGCAAEIEAPEGAMVVTICHHGVRSLYAVEILSQLAKIEATSLKGGIDAWSLAIDADVPRY